GTLLAVGQGKDSIYFKPDGTSPWGWIDLSGVSLARLERCVIHGGDAVWVDMGDEVLIAECRIYDMNIGIRDTSRAQAIQHVNASE
ncbi:hypothetical protein KJ815_01305, partial [bacterium]|nr:hypothetical protein [bacterium]